MRDVAVIGVGLTRFGEHWDKSLRDIGMEAGLEAINNAGINGEDIGALYVGMASPARFAAQEHTAPLIAHQVGLSKWHTPAVRVEAADASGAVAFREGYLAVASGMHDIVVVGGAEKMSDLTSTQMNEVLASAADQEWEAFFGATLPGLYAMMARKHMKEYGTTREQMALVSVKNHRNAVHNPYAQFRKEITLDTVLGSDMVADPLRMFDCAPASDGAAAVVLADMYKAKELGLDPVVRVAGSGMGSDALALHERSSITSMASTIRAARDAYSMAGIGPEDVDVAEVHDSFTIGEIIATEDLGFFDRGQGGKAVEDGDTALHGTIPVNPSGGLKARGHAWGATGIAQIVEVALHLMGRAEGRQVKGAKVGLAHSVGGTGATAVVHILEVV